MGIYIGEFDIHTRMFTPQVLFHYHNSRGDVVG